MLVGWVVGWLVAVMWFLWREFVGAGRRQSDELQRLRDTARRCADELQPLIREHARWQRNYEAGRYWGDDGDDAEPVKYE